MERGIPADNLHVWYEYADCWLEGPLGRVLDYGCGSGVLLARLAPRCDKLWGAEVDPERLASAQRRLPNGVFVPIDPGEDVLPLASESFDTVIISEVIEHVPPRQQHHLMTELARVLRPGGRLLLTTPHRGLLTFFDPGNVKFLLPGLHAFIHRTVLGQRDYYERRFGAERKKSGMIADFAVQTGHCRLETGDSTLQPAACSLQPDLWHRHYSYAEIRRMVPSELRTIGWAAYFPGFRALWSAQLGLSVLTRGLVRRLPPPFNWLYRGLSRCHGTWGDQLVVLFERV